MKIKIKYFGLVSLLLGISSMVVFGQNVSGEELEPEQSIVMKKVSPYVLETEAISVNSHLDLRIVNDETVL